MTAAPGTPLSLSFSRLSLYAGCPLRYRYLAVDRATEPAVPPDWSQAPRRLPPASAASSFDRSLGVAVHGALARWQRAVDGGAPARGDGLLAASRAAASRAGLDERRTAEGLARLEPGLRWYADGPWPRRATLFLEQRVSHVLSGADGLALELHLRVDRVARFRRGIAIIDFKTITPHVRELRVDEWQLRTYALAGPQLLGVAAERVHLVLLDLQRATETPVGCSQAELAVAAEELLANGRRIAAGDFSVADHPDRPCWSCGFRLACPSSLAKAPPAADG